MGTALWRDQMNVSLAGIVRAWQASKETGPLPLNWSASEMQVEERAQKLGAAGRKICRATSACAG